MSSEVMLKSFLFEIYCFNLSRLNMKALINAGMHRAAQNEQEDVRHEVYEQECVPL